MKRFHVSVAVTDLDRSEQFYTRLFGSEPTVVRDDYVKWMLDDPRINFSLATSACGKGISHVGLQADTMEELAAIQNRLKAADDLIFDQPDAECCYARSSKTWVRDPDDVAWETFVTHDEITHYGNDLDPSTTEGKLERCCR